MKDLRNKKLLVLAGAEVHKKVVQAAKEMGVYTIVTDYLPDSPAKEIADESWMLSITDIDLIIQKCRESNVDGVLNYGIDPGQIPYVRICSALGVPCYGTEEQFRSLVDKQEFKKVCQQCGVDIIQTYSEKQALDGNVDFPVFIKPSDSRGSRGQSVCYTEKDLKIALDTAKKESKTGSTVIEKYMKNKQDFSVTYFVHDSIPTLIRLCDRYLGREEDNLNKQCAAAISPSKYSDLYVQKVDEKVKNLIHYLGIKNGPVFMQGFWDGDTVRFYDPGFRFPGGQYELLLKKITGIDFVKAMVYFAVTGEAMYQEFPEALYELKGMHAAQFSFFGRAGTVGRFIGLETIKSNPSVVNAFARYKVGESIPNTGDVRQRACTVSLVVGKGDSVSDAVRWAQSVFDVLDTDGNSMLISSVDPEVLQSK